jgi:hypothetical protein
MNPLIEELAREGKFNITLKAWESYLLKEQ